MAAWVYGIVRRVRLWRQGRRDGPPVNVALACRRLFSEVLLQRRLRSRRPWANLAHKLLFSGFMVLLVGTTLVAIEHVLADLLGREANDPVFHKGVYFGVYELTMDAFGVAFLVGCTMMLVRRLRVGGSFARSPADVGILVLLIAIGVTGYVVEGLRIVLADTPLPGLSPVGYIAARLFRGVGVDAPSAATWHFALWWGHAVLALGFIALMPYTRLLHSLAGTVNLAIRDHSLGVMTPVSMEEIEATGRIGVEKLADFSRGSSWSSTPACPAAAAKTLAPHLKPASRSRRGTSSKIWSNYSTRQAPPAMCTATSLPPRRFGRARPAAACPTVCPLGLSPMRMITDMRRHLISEGAYGGHPPRRCKKPTASATPGASPKAIASAGRRDSTCRRLPRTPTSRFSIGSAAPPRTIAASRRSPAAWSACCKRPR